MFRPFPLDSNEMNWIEALNNNSGLNVTNSYVASFYRMYFYNKIYSIINIKGLPESIDERYFKNTLLTRGFMGVFNTEEYGLIANHGTVWDYDIYYNPVMFRAVNPKLHFRYERKIGIDVELVKLTPNFETVLPIIYYFADLMAVAVQGIDTNILNSKLAYVFLCENQKQAESFKKMVEEIVNGEGAVFADKKLFTEDGKLKVEIFNRDLKNTYIVDKLVELKRDIENDFNAYIGLSVVNTDKRERLITPEVELSNNNNRIIIELWKDTINKCLDKVNKMWDTNISCSLNLNIERGNVNVQTEPNTNI